MMWEKEENMPGGRYVQPDGVAIAILVEVDLEGDQVRAGFHSEESTRNLAMLLGDLIYRLHEERDMTINEIFGFAAMRVREIEEQEKVTKGLVN